MSWAPPARNANHASASRQIRTPRFVEAHAADTNSRKKAQGKGRRFLGERTFAADDDEYDSRESQCLLEWRPGLLLSIELHRFWRPDQAIRTNLRRRQRTAATGAPWSSRGKGDESIGKSRTMRIATLSATGRSAPRVTWSHEPSPKGRMPPVDEARLIRHEMAKGYHEKRLRCRRAV